MQDIVTNYSPLSVLRQPQDIMGDDNSRTTKQEGKHNNAGYSDTQLTTFCPAATARHCVR